jgi:hypothetical protein
VAHLMTSGQPCGRQDDHNGQCRSVKSLVIDYQRRHTSAYMAAARARTARNTPLSPPARKVCAIENCANIFTGKANGKYCSGRCKTRAYNSRHPLATIWRGMRQRCYDPLHPYYHRYGGRGISIYWQEFRDFEKYVIEAIGPRPSDKSPSGRFLWQLDRINNALGYMPGNIRWADFFTQAKNRGGMFA